MDELTAEIPKLDKTAIFRQPIEGDPRKPQWDTMVAAERSWMGLQRQANNSINPDPELFAKLDATATQVKKLHVDYYGQEVLDALAAGKL